MIHCWCLLLLKYVTNTVSPLNHHFVHCSIRTGREQTRSGPSEAGGRRVILLFMRHALSDWFQWSEIIFSSCRCILKCFLFGGDITFALPTCELLGVIPPMSGWRMAVTSVCFSLLYLEPRAVCWASRSSLSHKLTEDTECCMLLIWIWDKIKQKI